MSLPGELAEQLNRQLRPGIKARTIYNPKLWANLYKVVRGAIDRRTTIGTVVAEGASAYYMAKKATDSLFANGSPDTGDITLDKTIVKAVKKLPKSKIYMPKRYRRRKGKRKTLTKRVSDLEKGLAGKEYKYHDSNDSVVLGMNCTTGGDVDCLSEIAQGNTSITREGLTIRLCSLSLKYRVASHASATNGNIIRLMLVMDTANDGAYPAITDILETVTFTAHKEKHMDPTRGRFVVLMDRVHCLNNNIASTGVNIYRSYYKKWSKYAPKLHYDDSTAAEASNGKNALFLIGFGDENTNYATVSYQCRLRFTD